MAKVFSSMAELNKYILNHVNDVLANEEAKMVKENIQISVSEIVYGAGTPKVYDRRGGRTDGLMGNPIGTGSLGDPNEMTSVVNNGVLTVTDDADFNTAFAFTHGYGGVDVTKSLAENIIDGYGERDQFWNEPRDFIQDAKDNIEASKDHITTMRDGLRKRGLNVE